MLKNPSAKYRPFQPIDLPDRQWPNRTLTRAPIWCSVDLRDGNQALAVPMNVSQKLELFQTLMKCGLISLVFSDGKAVLKDFDLPSILLRIPFTLALVLNLSFQLVEDCCTLNSD